MHTGFGFLPENTKAIISNNSTIGDANIFVLEIIPRFWREVFL